MIRHKLLSAVSALALMGSVAAHADVNFTINGVAAAAGNGLTSPFAGQPGFVTQDFNPAPLLGTLPTGYSGSGQVVVGSVGGQYAQPTAGPNPSAGFNNSQYLTVPTGSSSGSVTITAPFLSSYFGLYWGSVDTYNSITFFRGSTQVASFVGQTIIDAPTPDLTPGSQQQAVYVNFFFTNGDAYDKIVLTSTQFAFESDNHVFGVVPVPGSAVLLLSGLLGAAFIGRRRKSS